MTKIVTEGILLSGKTEAEDHFLTPLILLGTSAAYLYLNLFVLPGTPILLSGDQVFFWMNGQRILHGELPYRDFFQFTPPGTDLVYFLVFKVFGPRIWIVNAVVLLLGVVLCWVCFEIARRLMDRGLAVLATLLFLTLIYSRLLNATHHWFSVLAIMTAILMRGNPRRLVLMGAWLGIATFFTQTHGIVALLAISWFLKNDTLSLQDFCNKESKLLAGFFIALVSSNAYFIAQTGLGQLIYCQVYYVLRVMVHKPEASMLGIPGPTSGQALSLGSLLYEYGQYFFVYAMLPLSYGLALSRSWRKPSNTRFRQPEVAILAIVGSSLLGELIFSLNWLRVYTVSMAGVILFIWLLGGAVKARRYLLFAVWTWVACLAMQRVWSAQRHDYVMAELPAGKCGTDTAEYEKLIWVSQHTKPGDFLFDAGWPGVYIPLGLRNPVFLDTAGTMLNSEWVQQAMHQLDTRQVRYVLWAERLDYPVDPRHPRTALIVPLRSHLHQAYQLVHVFRDGEEAWERN
jgi:Dolichyl-phosphate-mannose-protein mannosyltransferase